jgi:hypothetical protein
MRAIPVNNACCVVSNYSMTLRRYKLAACAAMLMCACTHKFDLSPIDQTKSAEINNAPEPSTTKSYSGPGWHVVFPPAWQVRNSNQKISDDIVLDVEAYEGTGEQGNIAFVASRLLFNRDLISPEAFALAAVSTMQHNGLVVADAVLLTFEDHPASIAIAEHQEKQLAVIQLAVMNGSNAHMFRCVGSLKEKQRVVDECFKIFNAISLDSNNRLKA